MLTALSLSPLLGRWVNESLDQVKEQDAIKAKRKQERDEEIARANKTMREVDDYEAFLGSMKLALSNYIVVVMNETNLQEQKFLFGVVSRWYDYQDQDASKSRDIFVVHNFRTTVSAREREQLFLVRTTQL